MNELKQIRTMAEIIIEKVDALAGAMPEHELTKVDREWYSGPPPHVGWWNASKCRYTDVWRWWNGEAWSVLVSELHDSESAGKEAAKVDSYATVDMVEWSDYWPANARVPRINPGVGK
jgi:hypothetical protein